MIIPLGELLNMTREQRDQLLQREKEHEAMAIHHRHEDLGRAPVNSESPAKPYGDPETGTIAIPQKPVEMLDTPDTEAPGAVTGFKVTYTGEKPIVEDWKPSDLIKQIETEKPQIAKVLGVPNAYPLAINTPLDRAYLRPLQQPLFDTEWFVPGKGIKTVSFFQRAIEHQYQYLTEIKSKHDTNMNQSAMLVSCEFSILGFRATLDSKTSQEDRDALLSHSALVEFCFSGSRPYLTVPFFDICAPSKDQHSTGEVLAARELSLTGREQEPVASKQARQEDDKRQLIDLAVQLLAKASGGGKNYYPFNLGRSALKIKPNEPFSLTLSWKKAPQVMRPVRIVMELVGLLWQPL